MKKLHLFVVLILLFGLIGPTGVVLAQDVCPNEGDWHKVEAGNPNFLSYTAEEGYIITAICAKGGSENSQGGYLVYMEADGTYTVNGQVCLTFSGIGTQTGSVSRNTSLEGNVCSDLSHASFKVGETSPTPEPPTPEPPTPEPPTPEPPTPEPPTPKPPTPPNVDTEPDTGASIVGPVLLGAGFIGGASLTLFFRKKKKMG